MSTALGRFLFVLLVRAAWMIMEERWDDTDRRNLKY
jgi:hypothetical protein